MYHVKLGSTGLDVSPVAIGAMTYGEPDRSPLARGRLARGWDDATSTTRSETDAAYADMLYSPDQEASNLAIVDAVGSDEATLDAIRARVPGMALK